MNNSPKDWLYLAPRPGSAYRQLYIKGTKFAAYQLFVETVASDSEAGRSPQEVADDYDIPVEAVQEAIAYCQSHPPEIREDFEYDEALAEATGMNDPNYKYHPSPRPIPPEEKSKLRRRS